MYREKERAAMRKAVVDVKNFIHQLAAFPNLAPEIPKEDFQVAYDLVNRVVMIESVSKPDKPTLNTEDLDP